MRAVHRSGHTAVHDIGAIAVGVQDIHVVLPHQLRDRCSLGAIRTRTHDDAVHGHPGLLQRLDERVRRRVGRVQHRRDPRVMAAGAEPGGQLQDDRFEPARTRGGHHVQDTRHHADTGRCVGSHMALFSLRRRCSHAIHPATMLMNT